MLRKILTAGAAFISMTGAFTGTVALMTVGAQAGPAPGVSAPAA